MGARARTARAALAAALAAVVLSGCGLGAGAGTSHVTVTVTKGFGTGKVASVTEKKAPGSETVMRVLERSLRVHTRYGGGFVESINGLAGNSSRLDWFYYVNGIEASTGAAATAVHHGDRIWWDLHDWSATQSIPAVVGSFPEPFVHGIGGKRLPTALECAADVGAACKTIGSAFSAAGVPAATQYLGTGSGNDSLAVDVGTWRDLRRTIAIGVVQKGPSLSGVYAKFSGPGGSMLQLLDPRGRVVRTLGAGAGLIAATGAHGSKPTWLVTGTDVEGVTAAARALTATRLHDRFALAVQGSHDYGLPVEGSS